MRNYQTKANRGALPDSITAEKFGAGEFNSLATEAKTAVSRAGLTLADSAGTSEDTTQLAQAMFLNGVKAQAFQAGGTANAIQLTPVSGSSGVKLPPDYSTMDGAKLRFKAASTNTGAATVNVGQTAVTLIGSKPLLDSSGAALTGGEVQSGFYYDIAYSVSDDAFILLQTPASETVRGVVELATSSETIAGTSSTLAVHPAGLAAAIAGISTTDLVARDQIALTNMRLMLNTSVSTGALVQGRQWELSTDEWGATSTGEQYTSSSPSYYTNLQSTSLIGSANAVITNFDGQQITLAQVRDGVLTQQGLDNTDGHYQGVTWAADVVANKLKFYSLQVGSYLINFKVEYFNGSIWQKLPLTSWITNCVQRATDEAASTTTTGWVEVGFASTTFRGVRVVGLSRNSSSSWSMPEMDVFGDSPGNMTLIPPASISLSSSPVYGDAYFLWKDDSGTAVLGTDLTVDLSRDGGTTWASASVSNLASFDGTYSIVRARADLSSQPSGTSMTCRIKTLNSKAQRVAAPALYAE